MEANSAIRRRRSSLVNICIIGSLAAATLFFLSARTAAAGLPDPAAPDSNAVSGRTDDPPADSLVYTQGSVAAPRWYDMIANVPGDWLRYGRETFQESEIPEYLGLTVATTALIVVDEPLWQRSHRWYEESRAVKNLSDFFTSLGDGRSQFGLAAGFAAYGLVAKDNRALRTASQTVEAILACGTVIQVLKHVTGRESPFVSTAPAGVWRMFPNQIEYLKHVPRYDAFPSGHIATTMATVIVVTENYPEWGVRPVGYVVAGLVGVAMGNRGIHWYSDYPLGLTLGYTFGMLAAHPSWLGSRPVGRGPQLSFYPSVIGSGAGLSIGVIF